MFQKYAIGDLGFVLFDKPAFCLHIRAKKETNTDCIGLLKSCRHYITIKF